MKKAKSVTLDDKVVQQVEKLAEQHGRTFSAMVNWILRKYFGK